MRVIVDPNCNILYGSFYLKGLWDVFGKKNVRFSSTPFTELNSLSLCFNFVVFQHGKSLVKVTIDMDDYIEIKPKHYNWCDVYGKVNTNWKLIDESYKQKVISLTPGFGINIWDLPTTCYQLFKNYFLSHHSELNFRRFLAKYKSQFLIRLPLSAYSHSEVDDNYLFHVSTLWQNIDDVNNDENVNRIRSIFIDTCKKLDFLNFEGGLYFAGGRQLPTKFKHLVFEKYMDNTTYMEKVKSSFVVFNTPAWLNCHGWKLGEYLALGKAIISTKFYNDLPVPLIHGENIHFVEDTPEDIRSAIELLARDRQYRIKLEQGALQYWNNYATPKKIIERMIGYSGKEVFE
jgi:hypothetical protein